MTITILLADDHSLIREGFRQLLQGCRDMEIVGEAGDGEETLKQVRKLQPQVVILDLSMPLLHGLDALPLIRQAAPETQILIFSMFKKEAYVHQALSAGAKGYVLKTAAGSEIIKAIRAVARGKYFLSSEINDEVIQRYLRPEEKPAGSGRYDQLSEREQQIFKLVVEGRSTKSIAELLCISPKTIEKHRSNIIKKLDIHEPIAMMKYAIKIGLVDPEIWPD